MDAASILILGALEKESITPQEEDYFRKSSLSGVTLFKRNISEDPSQLRRTNEQLQTILGRQLPALIAIDQEGGPFTSYRIDEATLFPGAMMLAATQDTELAKRVGEATAKELNHAGLTMNFAPVADVNSNPDNALRWEL